MWANFLLLLFITEQFCLHCALSCGAVYCNRPCLWRVGGVGLLPRYLEIACIDPHQTGFVGKGSDYLQLIRFWQSRAPGKGSTAGRKFLAPPYHRQPARSVCAPLSAFFIPYVLYYTDCNQELLCVHNRKRNDCPLSIDRYLASACVHCAGSATYEVTDPEPEP